MCTLAEPQAKVSPQAKMDVKPQVKAKPQAQVEPQEEKVEPHATGQRDMNGLEVQAGLRIVVRDAFDSGDSTAVPLAVGGGGLVLGLDADGDAYVLFTGGGLLSRTVVVFVTDFCKVTVEEPG